MTVDELDRERVGWDVFVPPARGGRWPWNSALTTFLGLVALTCLVAASSLWAVEHFESRLEKTVRADLKATGVSTDQLEFDWDYRNVSVTGQLPVNVTEEQLLAELREADGRGIREISLALKEAQQPQTDGTEFGTIDVSVKLENGQMLLEGTVLTESQRDQLQVAAESASGVASITNRITVSGLRELNPGADQRVASLANSITGLNQAFSADARLSASDFRFNATVADEDQANDLLRLRGNAGDVGLVISGDIVARKSTPDLIDAIAKKDNGRILLTGTVTTESQKETILRAAVNAFDEQSVIDELLVTGSGESDSAVDQSIDVLVSAISYFDDAIEADAHLTPDEFEFNALMEFEEDIGPLLSVRDTARNAGLSIAGNIEARQMSLSREVEMLQAEIINLAAEIQENVVFESGRADLGFAAKQTLDKIVDAMNRYPRPVVEVAGHTDDSGADDANQRLSLFRATAVSEYLKDSGIDSARLQAIGFGEVVPIASNNTEFGRSQNRRVEFIARGNFGN